MVVWSDVATETKTIPPAFWPSAFEPRPIERSRRTGWLLAPGCWLLALSWLPSLDGRASSHPH